MIFISGSTFLGGDELTIPCTPTNIYRISDVELSGTMVDTLYVCNYSDDDDISMIENNEIPITWNHKTIMYAEYDNDTSAGNVNWHLKDLSHIIIKIKPQDEYKWITTHVKKIENYDDLVIVGRFLAATTGTYDVSLVPISSGTIEGTYIIVSVDISVTKLVLIDSDGIHSTFLTDGSLSTQSVMPNQAVNTIHNKFPYIVRNTRANYETVNVSATFLPNNDDECVEITPTHEKIKYPSKWNRELKAWIMNGKTKLLKNVDGDMWLGYITTPVSDEPYENNVYEYRKLSFGLTETGLPNKEKDLYDAGLLDSSVTNEWWS